MGLGFSEIIFCYLLEFFVCLLGSFLLFYVLDWNLRNSSERSVESWSSVRFLLEVGGRPGE